MTSGREITPPPGFLAIPITTTMFVATTPENTPVTYHASTLTNPNSVISPAFVKANYKAPESFLRDRRRQMHNNDLRTELGYFSKDYDEEQEMEPRPEPTRAATLPLRVASPRIQDYPLPDGLKMPSHIGSYDGKEDPDDFLNLFEGAIQMKKWLMLVACHMFTYTLKDSAKIWWNTQKAGSILDYEDLKEKFQSHFSQQKKFTKTHLAVHNIKQREDESTRSFITRYTDDTLQILGLNKEQRISGFVHGLRTSSLVKHISTDLPSTYKGLMEKTYTWVEAREVATNGASRDQRDSFERSKKSFKDNNRGQKNKDRFSPYRGPNHSLLPSLSKVRRKFSLRRRLQEASSHLQRCSETPQNSDSRGCKLRTTFTPRERNKKEKKSHITPHEEKVRQVYMDSEGSCEIIYEHCFEKLNSTIKATKVDLKNPLVGFSREHSWSIGEVLLEITIKDAPLLRTETFNFVIVRSDSSHNMLLGRMAMQRMGIVVSMIHRAIKFHTKKESELYFWQTKLMKEQRGPERYLPQTRKGSSVVSTLRKNYHKLQVSRPNEHKLNEYSHVKPIKQNKRGLGPDRNMAAFKETEERTKVRILWKVKHQTWVANPVMRSVKCFLDAYKRYHQIQMAEEDERQNNLLRRRMSLLLQEDVVWSQKCKGNIPKVSGQADFLVEIPFEDNEKKEKPKEVPYSNSKWRLYTNGASNSDGSGAGIMLIDPEGKEYTYSLRFEFETMNNEPEYEALLVGLRIAQEIEISKVAIFIDSQLLEPEQDSRCAKQTGINDLRTSHKGSTSRSFDQKVNRGKKVLKVNVQERKSYMDPIHEYMLSELLPEDTKEARKIRIQAPQYKLIRENYTKDPSSRHGSVEWPH
nr:hypothetical protein [Tanacetum cinerariifolium]